MQFSWISDEAHLLTRFHDKHLHSDTQISPSVFFPEITENFIEGQQIDASLLLDNGNTSGIRIFTKIEEHWHHGS
jgi:hypothetical protein